jgi:hypothetical protein
MIRRAGFSAAAFLLMAASAYAAPIAWNNTTGDWGVNTNWNPTTVPNIQGPGADTVTINNGGTVTYSGTDGDWRNNTTVLVDGSGSSWVQSTNNWLKIADGTGTTGSLTVSNGGSFDISAAGNAFIGNGGVGTLLVDNGTFKAQSILVNPNNGTTNASLFTVQGNSSSVSATNIEIYTTGKMNITSGIVSDTGQWHPRGAGLNGTISGGLISATVLSFDGDTSATYDISGGTILSTDGGTFQGLFTTGGYLNFTAGSTGAYDVINGGITLGQATSLITDGRIRHQGLIAPADFVITPIANGYEIKLLAVPEPASLGLMALGALALLRRRKA